MKNYNKLKLVAVLSAIIFAACTTGPFDEVTPQQSVQTRAWYDDGNDDEDGDDIPDMKDGYGDPWGDDDGDGIVNGVDEDYDWGDGNSGGGNSGGFDVYPFCDFETDALEKELFVILGNGDSTLLETNWNILDPFFSQHEPLCYFPEEYSMVLSIAQLFAYKEVPSTSTFGVTSTQDEIKEHDYNAETNDPEALKIRNDLTSIINQIFNELSQIPFNDGDHLTDLIARYMKSKSFLAYYAATAKPYEMTSGATYAENYIIEMLDRGDLVIMESRGLTFIVDGYGRYGGDLMIHCSIGGGHTFFNTIGWHWSDSFTYYESYIVKYGLSFITNPDWDAEMGTNRPLDSLVPTNPGFSGTRSGGSSTSATFKP